MFSPVKTIIPEPNQSIHVLRIIGAGGVGS